jgi:uncharacterized protein (TIRG00374 family)
MKSKVYAIGLLVGLVSFGLMAFTGPWQALRALSWGQWQMLAVAFVFVLVSSLLRAARTRSILNFGKSGSLLSHFRALAAGSVINAVIPFRLGEILRSYLLARKLGIGLGFTLVAVAFERLIDVVLVVSLFLGALWFTNDLTDAPYFFWDSITVLMVAFVTTLLLVMSIRQNKLLLKALWKLTMFLNPHLSGRLKMSFWRLVHGFQTFTLDIRAVLAYIFLAVGSWILSVSAVGIVYLTMKGPTSLAATLTPFIAPEFMFRLSGIDSLLNVMGKNLEFFEFDQSSPTLQVVSVTWVVLNAPLAVLGFFALLTPKTYLRSPSSTPGDNAFTSRTKASELEAFLDSFFRRDELAEAVHGLTVDGSVTPIRFFKGGSSALTLLAEVDGEVVVRKIVSVKYQEKLREQYTWLRQFRDLPYIASPIRELAAGNCYMFDLEFVHSQDMFSWLHTVQPSMAEAKIEKLLSSLRRDVYVGALDSPSKVEREEIIEKYLQDWIYGRLLIVEQASPTLAEIINNPHVYVNGNRQRGLRLLLDLILNDAKTVGTLADYQATDGIHGDLTIDNMIIDGEDNLILIDPDNNSIRSPVVDFSRLLQSLEGGYEFLNQLESSEVALSKKDGGRVWTINYPIRRSMAYDSLALTVRQIAKKELSSAEYSNLELHVGLFFVRMLTHRLRISPETTPAYVATAGFFLERFLSQNGKI